MICFLPYEEYEKSAACLDRQRLGKQRSEAVALLRAFVDPKHRLFKHPACRMWSGHKNALAAYGLAICVEWTRRGYQDSTALEIQSFVDLGITPTYDWLRKHEMLPRWSGLPKLHDSHKSNLLRKDKVWYGAFGWNVSSDLAYHWPVLLFNFEDAIRGIK